MENLGFNFPLSIIRYPLSIKIMFLFDAPAIEVVRDVPLSRLWLFLPFGYLLTILIETPVLLIGLSPKITLKQRLWCGAWLTACTYPVVILVLPALMQDFSKFAYLFVAEIFAPAGECLFFWLVFRGKNLLERKDWVRSVAAIVSANLASFGIGEIFNRFEWFGFF